MAGMSHHRTSYEHPALADGVCSTLHPYLEVILMPRRPGERYADSRRKTREQRYNASRPARHEFYATPEWRRLRDWYRARHPLCEECQRQGRVTAAELVHHKVEISQGGEPLDAANLESLCRSCHSKVHGFNQG